MMQTLGIVLATHPFQIALTGVALYQTIRMAVREYSASRALRSRRLVIVGATSRRAAAMAA
jgi:hypothetical protein